MTIKIRKSLVSPNKYSIKCPNSMKAEYITYHNTYNDASAENEVAYMIRNNNQVSYHFAVDDKEVVQGLPLDRNGWHCGDGGNGTGNRKSIGIEVCYSKSGGKRYDKAEVNANKFVAQLLYERGWGVNKVKPHHFWSGKNCPHRILDAGRWNDILESIDNELDKLKGTSKPTQPSKPTTPSKPKPSPKPPTSKPKNPVIRQGDRGVSVQKAQTALVSKGYSVGKSGADSIFGKDTDTAVRAIQRDGKIKVDGIIGKDTWKLLNGSFSKPKPNTSKPSGTIKVGDKVVLSKSATKFSTGETIISSAKGKTYTVKQVKSDRVLLDEITSWVFVKDVGGNVTSTPSPSKSKTLKVGSKVKIKSSAKNYSRVTTSIPSSRKNKTYTIEQVSKSDVLIKELYSWVKKTDLI